MTRDNRQAISQEKYIASGGRGTIEATPAYGKTRVALNIISYFLRSKKDRSMLVVVPNIHLKSQWEDIIRKTFVPDIPDISVVVINTAIKEPRTCDLLILDKVLSN
jgi:superfamily II DNA or RNA helicase